MKRLAWIVLSLIIALAGFWVVAVPEDLVKGMIENSLKDERFAIRIEGYRKGLFYRFHADTMQVLRNSTGKESAGKTLFLLRDVSGRISPSSLLSFQPALSFDGAVEGGTISGTVSLMGKTRIDVKAEGLTLSALPLPESLGVTGTGLFTGVFHSEGSAGEFRFTLLNAKIRGTSPVLSFIPLDRFNEVRGAGMISGGSMDIRSLSLAGKGVNARLKGKVAGTRVDLTMELMTDSSFTPDPLFQSLIERYRVSPGYYLVPVKAS